MARIRIWVPSILAGLVIAAYMVPNIPNLPSVLGHSLYMWLVFGLLVIQIIALEKRLWDIDNAHPRIFPDDYGFDKMESAFPLWNSGIPTDYTVKRYFLSLRNKGEGAIDTTPVHASISFYDIDCKELAKFSHEKPFWFNSKPRNERKLAEDHDAIIKASGEPEGVCLVAKRSDDLFIYPFSDDSYAPGTSNVSLDRWDFLPYSQVYICVKLSAANFRKDYIFWVSLICPEEKSLEPKFTILNKSPCRAST